jgi:L-alanine-DL-glutamate epimerase-like enolase superfamily enzyme
VHGLPPTPLSWPLLPDENGDILVLQKPGLGVELNPDLVKRN